MLLPIPDFSQLYRSHLLQILMSVRKGSPVPMTVITLEEVSIALAHPSLLSVTQVSFAKVLTFVLVLCYCYVIVIFTNTVLFNIETLLSITSNFSHEKNCQLVSILKVLTWDKKNFCCHFSVYLVSSLL